ncbi:MAG: hypothetical protein NUV64_02945 [Parcubacteria group bacterium]|nr:hypothetical protein [Parcubacteria group bacterium]MCR4342826.1 hypothetical protein [Patescibacteria group bacterium]
MNKITLKEKPLDGIIRIEKIKIEKISKVQTVFLCSYQIIKKSLIIAVAIIVLLAQLPILNAFEAYVVSVTAKIERMDIKTCDDDESSEDDHKDDDEEHHEEESGHEESVFKDAEDSEDIAEESADEIVIDEKPEDEIVIEEEFKAETEEDNSLPEYPPYQEEDEENQEVSASDII